MCAEPEKKIKDKAFELFLKSGDEKKVLEQLPILKKSKLQKWFKEGKWAAKKKIFDESLENSEISKFSSSLINSTINQLEATEKLSGLILKKAKDLESKKVLSSSDLEDISYLSASLQKLSVVQKNVTPDSDSRVMKHFEDEIKKLRKLLSP